MRSQGIRQTRRQGLGIAAAACLLLVACGKSNSTAPCAMVGCGDTPLCTVGCTAQCGCCPCANGQISMRGSTPVICAGTCWMPFDGGTDATSAPDGKIDGMEGTGGGPGTGGNPGTGGASNGSGGGGTGGLAGLGGGVASGGASGGGGAAAATGGRSGSGGVPGTGGATAGGADGGMDAPADAATGGTGDATGDAATDVAPGDGSPPPSGAVDIVFLVDDSNSMAPLQAKLAQAFSGFMNTLEALPGGLPSIHLAVVSSSLGAGAFNVTGCAPGTDGNRGGAFLHPATCTALPAGERFLISDGAVKNFTGDISDVFGCMAMIGANGCGFEHQFEATRRALVKAQTPGDPDNGGFLRANAHLAVIMLTNEDDCSAGADSTLFDPNQGTIADAVGGLQSYRCNEFGHLCSGVAPPHLPPATPVTLTDCVPAEAQGRLTSVSEFVAFLGSVKPSSGKTFVAAMAGPVTPYVVESKAFFLGNGGMENQPTVQHSCSNPTGTYADPAVRIKTWVDAFGANGLFESLCPDDLGPPMMRIAQALANAIR